MFRYVNGDFPKNTVMDEKGLTLSWGLGKNKMLSLKGQVESVKQTDTTDEAKTNTFTCYLKDGRKFTANADKALIKRIESAKGGAMSYTDFKAKEEQEAQEARQREEESKVVKCPKCGSKDLSANKKGFGIGKAVVGHALVGGIGLVAGNIGAKKIRITCLNCGHEFWAGEKE